MQRVNELALCRHLYLYLHVNCSESFSYLDTTTEIGTTILMSVKKMINDMNFFFLKLFNPNYVRNFK